MTRKSLIAAVLSIALPTLAAAQAAPASPAQGVTITPYGFILAAGFFSDGLFGTVSGTPAVTTSQMDYPSFALPGRGGTFFSARQSRFGLRFDFPEALGATIKGVIEADFKGGYAGTTNNNNQAYVPVPRLRLAFLSATWKQSFGNVGIGAGQEYGLVNPLFATSSAWVADPIFYYAGNLWRRATQLRVFGDFGLPSALGVTWAAAIEDPIDQVRDTTPDYGPGNQSRMPDLDGRVALNWKQNNKLVAEVGLGGWYGKERYVGTAGAVNVTKRLVGVDAQVNLPVPAIPITLKGEWFNGSNIDTYWGDFGAGVVGAPDAPHGVRSTGYWAQVVLQPASMFQLVGGVGIEDPKDSDLPGAAGTKLKNRMVEAGVIFTPSKTWRAGVEWGHTTTTYRDQGSQSNNQIAVSTALTF
jgi:hypothetical protein